MLCVAVFSKQVALAPPSAVFAPGLPRPLGPTWRVPDGVFRYVRLPRREERSSSLDGLFEAELRGHLFETAWYAVLRILVPF